MPRRYYRSKEDQAFHDVAGFSIALLIAGVFALGNAIRPRPQPYSPATPIETEQESKSSDIVTSASVEWLRAIISWCVGLFLLYLAPHASQPSGGVGPSSLFFYGVTIFFLCCAVYFTRGAIRMSKPPVAASITPIVFNPAPMKTYNIFPQKTDASVITSSKLMHSLLAMSPHLIFQIDGSSQGIRWQILDPKGKISSQSMRETIRTHIEGAAVLLDGENTDSSPTAHYPFYRKIIFFGLANDYAAPLFHLDYLKHYDPLTAITNRMSFVQPNNDERILYTMVTLVPTEEAKRIAGERIKEGLVRPLSGLLQDQQGKETILDPNVLDAKLMGVLYHTFLAVTIESRDEKRVTELAAIANEVNHFANPGYNLLKIAVAGAIQKIASKQDDLQYTALSQIETWSAATSQDMQWRDALLILSPSELTSLWHIPNEEFRAGDILWAGLQIPEELTKSGANRTIIGDVNEFGRTVTISLPVEDRSTHQYITGKTRMGKSTLLHNLIHQDIQMGLGTVIIDPHGKLIDDVLTHSIPQIRLSDVVLLECGNIDYPVPLNPFRRPAGITHESAFNTVFWTLQKIYESIWLQGRTEMAIRNVVSALLLDPEATPLDIQRVFMEPAYRDYLMKRIANHERGNFAVAQYWQTFNAMSQKQKTEIYEPILSRSGAFLGNYHLNLMTCHPNTLDLREFILQRKIVLINLSGEAIKSEVSNLSAIFLSSLFMASEALGYVTTNIPRVSVYVDEAERILATPLPDMFSQARKFGLALTLAHQYMKQLDDATIQSILGNVGTQFIFEVGDKDATLLGKYTEPDIAAEKLMTLGAYHMAVKTRVGGKTLPAVIARTRNTPDIGKEKVDASTVRRRMPSTLQLMNRASVHDFLTRRYMDTKQTQAASTSAPSEEPAPNQGDGLEDFE